MNAFHEDFGPNSLLGRSSDHEVVLTRILRDRLEALNPGLSAAALRRLFADSASQSPAAVNREKYALIRDGVAVEFKKGRGTSPRCARRGWR